MRTSRRTFLAGTAACGAAPAFARTQGRDTLAASFLTPPDAAKPRVWWHWMNGNITRDGIAQDLAWMKRIGIGGLQNFDVALATPQIVEQRLSYMTEEWKQALRFAVQRAASLDLEFGIAASPGWSETGGPWVEPKDAMKKLVWSESVIEGGSRHRGVLPSPPSNAGPFQSISMGGDPELYRYYGEGVVLAYPTQPEPHLPLPRVTANGAPIDGALLAADEGSGIPVPPAAAGNAGYVQYEYATAVVVRSAIVFVDNVPPFSALGVVRARLEASENGRTWRKLAETELRNAPTTLSFPPSRARLFRLSVELPAGGGVGAAMGLGAARQNLVQFELTAQARVNEFEKKAGFAIVDDYFGLDASVGADVSGVDPATVRDVTEHMSADGSFDWTPPAGQWKLLRFGYSLTGKQNAPATAEATGLEVDKFDGATVAAYVDTYLDMYSDAVGADLMGQRGLGAILTDSTSVGPSNWTPGMLEHFQRLRGYDAKPYLPALTGEIIGSRTQSDAFLFDWRQTLAELQSTEHYGVVARRARERGLIVYGESLEANRAVLGDDLDMRSFADIPMSAMWTFSGAPIPGNVADGRGAASVAHVLGRQYVACESLTSFGQPWGFAPRDLQPMVDAVFLAGVNRPVIHTSVHQPTEQAPGLALGIFGQYFNRHETWAEMARPWMDYIARTSFLLQQGRNVADVAYFYGEDTPVSVLGAARPLPDLPRHYAYDFVSANMLLNALACENGALVTPGGARYQALLLNSKTQKMTLPVLRGLERLVEAGATIVGEPPQASPALRDDRRQFAEIVRRLWSGGAITQVGRGRVFSGRDIEGALAQIGVAPAFLTNAPEGVEIAFVQRKLGDTDLYFVSNRSNRAQDVEARFRVSGKAPELWRADTGAVELASYRLDGEQTIVPLTLGPHESHFVVFRSAASAQSATFTQPALRLITDITGAWDVRFQAGRGAPAQINMPNLGSLSDHSDTGIKYFSGVATYTKSFDAPRESRRGQPLWLDVGAIGDIAEVRVNGRFAGTVWKAPYRLNIEPFMRRGSNRLEIKVANLWVNRLIGDQQAGAEKIAFTTVPTYPAAARLRPSGLIGPVTLWIGAEA